MLTRALERLAPILKRESTRRYLYGVTESVLYAAIAFGLIAADRALVLLAIPAALLNIARGNVQTRPAEPDNDETPAR